MAAASGDPGAGSVALTAGTTTTASAWYCAGAAGGQERGAGQTDQECRRDDGPAAAARRLRASQGRESARAGRGHEESGLPCLREADGLDLVVEPRVQLHHLQGASARCLAQPLVLPVAHGVQIVHQHRVVGHRELERPGDAGTVVGAAHGLGEQGAHGISVAHDQHSTRVAGLVCSTHDGGRARWSGRARCRRRRPRPRRRPGRATPSAARSEGRSSSRPGSALRGSPVTTTSSHGQGAGGLEHLRRPARRRRRRRRRARCGRRPSSGRAGRGDQCGGRLVQHQRPPAPGAHDLGPGLGGHEHAVGGRARGAAVTASIFCACALSLAPNDAGWLSSTNAAHRSAGRTRETMRAG